jgi:hypothetical protein
MVSYQVARTGKPHTIVEELILRSAGDMAGTMLGEKNKKTIQTMSSSNNTVSRRISDMAGDVLKQLMLRIQASDSMCYSWMSQQTWPGTAPGICPFCLWGSIKEDIIFCKPLETRTGEDIFKVLDSFVTSNGLWWSRCVGICTDGTKAMTGRHNGMVIHVQAVAPNAPWVHCSIH